MKKYDSLLALRGMGLNIMPAMLYSLDTKGAEIRRRLGVPPWAIRSERQKETSCPFIRGYTTPVQLLREAKKLQGKGYDVLFCAQPREGNKPLANGLCLLPPRDHAIYTPLLEYGETETQRDLEHVSLRRLDFFSRTRKGSLEDVLIAQVLGEAATKCPRLYILEWSFFTKPCGELRRQDVWWEIRPWMWGIRPWM